MSDGLIAVITCHRLDYDLRLINPFMALRRRSMANFRPSAIRETWWKDVPELDKKFFYGSPAIVGKDDEVFLYVPDNYAHLPQKVRATCTWALEHGYRWLLKVDDDSFVYVDRFLKSDFASHPWTGRYNGEKFIAGGPAYVLNYDAMKVISGASINQQEWAEDIWVSKTLINAGFKPHWDDRYVELQTGQISSSTIAVCECTREKMLELHKCDLIEACQAVQSCHSVKD